MHQYTHNAHDAGPHDILARSNVGGTATRITHRAAQFDDIGQCHFPPQMITLPRTQHSQSHKSPKHITGIGGVHSAQGVVELRPIFGPSSAIYY
jgi:hypothetical protein